MGRTSSFLYLAPVAADAFKALADDLARDTPFLPFETYRDPAAQQDAKARGTSKAGPMLSPHQFGLAVDFVPFIDGNWTWHVPDTMWRTLTERAEAHGLKVPIAWDRSHVEHPRWPTVFRNIRRTPGT